MNKKRIIKSWTEIENSMLYDKPKERGKPWVYWLFGYKG